MFCPNLHVPYTRTLPPLTSHNCVASIPQRFIYGTVHLAYMACMHVYAQIYAKTRDDHFELVVVNFDSQSEDMSIVEKLEKSSINRCAHTHVHA